MKKSTKTILLIATAAASMYAYNRYIEEKSISKNLLKDDKGTYYDWKLGRVYYTKEGQGAPILMIHDLQPSSSSYEWKKIIHKLKKNHTVYSLDLLGCGRSDKPEIEYTNYMYVQLISSFVKEIIKSKTDIIVSNQSSSFIIMANQMDKELFRQIILINPVSIKKTQMIPDQVSKIKKTIINLPIIGTFIYNITMCPKIMELSWKKRLSKETSSTNLQSNIEVFYESAHLKQNKGKYLYASILGNYINLDIYRAVKNTDKKIYIITSQQLNKSILVANEYHKINSNYEVKNILSNNPYPHMEESKRITNIISSIIE